jgi:hypothetical protein
MKGAHRDSKFYIKKMHCISTHEEDAFLQILKMCTHTARILLYDEINIAVEFWFAASILVFRHFFFLDSV